MQYEDILSLSLNLPLLPSLIFFFSLFLILKQHLNLFLKHNTVLYSKEFQRLLVVWNLVAYFLFFSVTHNILCSQKQDRNYVTILTLQFTAAPPTPTPPPEFDLTGSTYSISLLHTFPDQSRHLTFAD